MAVNFVAAISNLDFAQLEHALSDARSALDQGSHLAITDLNPTSLLGEFGTAIDAVMNAHLDPSNLSDLGGQALGALGELVGLPDLSGLQQVIDGLAELGDRLGSLVGVLSGGGDGTAILDRLFGALSGSLDVETLVKEITDRAIDALRPEIGTDLGRVLQAMAALAHGPSPGDLVGIVSDLFLGLDIAAVTQLVTNAEHAVAVVASAGDFGPLEAAAAAVRGKLDAAYALLAAPTIDVDAVVTASADIGTAVDAVAGVLPDIAGGVATDLRTVANSMSELNLISRLAGLVDALPLPGEDLPQELVDSLSGMADHLEQLTGAALTEALAAMRDELLTASGLDQLANLLSGLDEIFDEVVAELDRLPLRALRDDAVAELAGIAQRVLAFDGLNFIDEAFVPIKELEAKVRTLDLSTITGAVHGFADQVNGLLTGVDITPVKTAIEGVVGPLGDIVDELVPFVQQVADQLSQLVDQLKSIDFHAAGAATTDLLHGIRGQVTNAVGSGDVPEPVKAAVGAAAGVLKQLDVAAQITAPFDSAVVSIDVDALVQPIENIWQVAGDALKKATPSALIAELDPPFEQFVSAIDSLSLQPLIDAVQRLFDDLIAKLQPLDPRNLFAPLEKQFQDLISTVTAALDPAPLFAPLREAYQALQDLLHQIDVRALLHGVLGGLAEMPGQMAQVLGEKAQAATGGAVAALAASADDFKLGDILRPLALLLDQVRTRLTQLGAEAVEPAFTALATATRGLRALVDPEDGFAVRLADSLDARLALLDPDSGTGALAQLRTDLLSYKLAVQSVEVGAAPRARLSASADAVQFDARVNVTAHAELQDNAAQVRASTVSADLGRNARKLCAALDALLPVELLTGTPAATIDALLHAVLDRFDPTHLAEELDAIGDRIEARFVALAEQFATGLFQLFDSLFGAITPLMPDNVISRLQAGIDRVLSSVTVLDPQVIEDEVRELIRAAISLLAVHSPAAVAAQLGSVFDACIAQLNTLSPATLFAGLDPFGPIKTQLEDMKPSVILAPLVESTAGFTTALDTIAHIDLSFAVDIVTDLKQTFHEVLTAVQEEWNTLLDELAQISGGASASVSVG